MKTRKSARRLQHAVSQARVRENRSPKRSAPETRLKPRHLEEIRIYLENKKTRLTARRSEAFVALQLEAVEAAIHDLNNKFLNGVEVYLNSQTIFCRTAIEDAIDKLKSQPNKHPELLPRISIWRTEVAKIEIWLKLLNPERT